LADDGKIHGGEMMDATQIYLILKLDTVSTFLALIYSGCIIGMLLYIRVFQTFIAEMLEEEQPNKTKAKKSVVIVLSVLCLFCIVVDVMLPSTKQMVQIMVLPLLLSSKNIDLAKKIPEKLLAVLGVSLDELKSVLIKKVEAK
jgi:NADH:ubiquinone oxidoreductase subunit 6 (subunit J)